MLNHLEVATKINTDYTSQKDDHLNLVLDRWMNNWMTVYDEDSLNGTMSAPSVKLVSFRPLLEFDRQNGIITASNWATAISNYWQAQLTKGTPTLCGNNIVSITNDAAKIQPTIESYLLSQISTEKLPYYDQVFAYIESQVNTIIWTVTELGGVGCSQPISYSVSVV